MKGKMISLVLLLITVFSCEFRWDDASKENQAPELFFLPSYQNGAGNENLEKSQMLTDSIKIGQKTNAGSYTFYVEVEDDYPELIEIGTSYDATEGEVTAITSIETNVNVYQLEYVPSSIGIGKEIGKRMEKKELTIYAKDHYGKRSNIYLELMVYDNLIPKAVMQYKQIGSIRPGHFEINAIYSYDQDAKYGGYITEYAFEIDGKKIQTKKSIIEYIFQEPGQYELKLKVKDNDGEWSEELRALIPINF